MADRSTSGGYSLKNKDGHQMINSRRIQSFLFAARLRFPPGIPWAPEDIVFLSILILRGEAASRRRKASREPYKPVSTVYFILGIFRTDSGARVLLARLRKISWFVSVSQINYLPKSKAGANNWYTSHWQITIFCSTSSNYQGHPTAIFGKISVRKTIWELEFSEHLL